MKFSTPEVGSKSQTAHATGETGQECNHGREPRDKKTSLHSHFQLR